MKRILSLVMALIFPALAFAQTNAQQNEAGTSYLPNAGNISSNIAVDRALRQIITLSSGVSAVTNPIKLEDTAQTSGDAGIPAFAVRNEGTTSFADSNLDYSFLGVNRFGGLYVEMASDHQFAGNSTSLLKNEDSVSTSQDAGVAILGKKVVTPASQADDGDYTFSTFNDVSAMYVDGVRRSSFSTSQPSIATATSTTIASASGNRRYLFVQNNSAANIMINVSGASLTGIVPTSTNAGIVLAAGASWQSPPNFAPVDNIRAYQTSGATINTVTVVEGY